VLGCEPRIFWALFIFSSLFRLIQSVPPKGTSFCAKFVTLVRVKRAADIDASKQKCHQVAFPKQKKVVVAVD
jgi:hypothetical protein